MKGRAATSLRATVPPDDAALAAAVLGVSTALLAAIGLALLAPPLIPAVLIGTLALALAMAQRLGRNTAADPTLLGAVSAAPVLTLALLLMPGLGAAGMLGLPVAASVAVAAGVAAARARPPADAPPTCPRCGYNLEGLSWMQGGTCCPECAFPEAPCAAGRVAFLRGMLGRRRIFRTDAMHARLDRPARENMERELKDLERREA